jgi:hypothetical protein
VWELAGDEAVDAELQAPTAGEAGATLLVLLQQWVVDPRHISLSLVDLPPESPLLHHFHSSP